MTDGTAEKIRDALVRDSASIVEEELDRVQELLNLDEQGNIYLNVRDLSMKSEILARLVGHFYGAHSGLTDEPTVSTGEIAEEMGQESKVVSARLSDLKSAGFVESPSRGEYKIKEPRLPEILDHLEEEER